MPLVSGKMSHCPYCGESIELFVDPSITEQQYIEDCEVCCRPINVSVRVDSDGNIEVNVTDENSC